MFYLTSDQYWVLFGLAAQGLFFMRFVSSWWASERANKTVIPVYFWYFSIVGASMTLVYSIHRQDVVFITSQSLAMLIYSRSLWIHYRGEKGNK